MSDLCTPQPHLVAGAHITKDLPMTSRHCAVGGAVRPAWDAKADCTPLMMDLQKIFDIKKSFSSLLSFEN